MAKFISLEGIDGCGKTTAFNFIKQWFDKENIKTIAVREPGGTKISESIRDILLNKKNQSIGDNCELLLMFAARSQLIKEIILPAIEKNINVISDRFVDSTYAYQGYGRGIPAKLIDQLHNIACNNLKPDITFLLDVDVKTALKRVADQGNKDRFENENIDFYQKVRHGYLSLAKLNHKRFVVIDGTKSLQEVQNQIQQNLISIFSE
ncbi:MAG: dTMP kinase [Gammaproteobacteria bacterium]|nr:MAG: dTMP kinase [Gammaproteobacteria bacterium]